MSAARPVARGRVAIAGGVVLMGVVAWLCLGHVSFTPRVMVNPRDGSELVWVPAGPFVMGCDDAEYDERPAHTVTLDGYWIGRYPVTNRQFALFVNAVGNKADRGIPWLDPRVHYGMDFQSGRITVRPGWEDMPVVGVSWHGARAYCDWAGLRLPTEAEWEKAARGTDQRAYPWGNAWQPGWARCSEDLDQRLIDLPPPPNSEPRVTSVTAHPQSVSPYGCWEMAGSKWEWCSSLYVAYPYNADDGRENPNDEGARVIRGGAWYLPHIYARTTNRYRKFPYTFDYQQKGANGFRVARSAVVRADANGVAELPERPHPARGEKHVEPLRLTPQDDNKYRVKANGRYAPSTILGYPVTTERALRYPLPWERLLEMIGYQRNHCAEPDKTVEMAQVRPHDVVADIGAGSGNFTLRLARKAYAGKVWATDISVSSLEFLQQRLKQENVRNVYLVLHDQTDPLLPVHGVDVAFMSDIHYFYYPRAKPGASPPRAQVLNYFRAIRRALKPSGHFVLLEISDVHPDQDAERGKLTRADIEREMDEAGFVRQTYKRLDCWIKPPTPGAKRFLSMSRFFFIFKPKPGLDFGPKVGTVRQ